MIVFQYKVICNIWINLCNSVSRISYSYFIVSTVFFIKILLFVTCNCISDSYLFSYLQSWVQWLQSVARYYFSVLHLKGCTEFIATVSVGFWTDAGLPTWSFPVLEIRLSLLSSRPLQTLVLIFSFVSGIVSTTSRNWMVLDQFTDVSTVSIIGFGVQLRNELHNRPM